MNPYENLDDRSFWRPVVSQRNPFDIADLYTPKFTFRPTDRIATAEPPLSPEYAFIA